jgi:hypothetical protein
VAANKSVFAGAYLIIETRIDPNAFNASCRRSQIASMNPTAGPETVRTMPATVATATILAGLSSLPGRPVGACGPGLRGSFSRTVGWLLVLDFRGHGDRFFAGFEARRVTNLN